LLTGELPPELLDGHSFADESLSAYVKADESAAKVCPVC
jgi:hypothetical protein